MVVGYPYPVIVTPVEEATDNICHGSIGCYAKRIRADPRHSRQFYLQSILWQGWLGATGQQARILEVAGYSLICRKRRSNLVCCVCNQLRVGDKGKLNP